MKKYLFLLFPLLTFGQFNPIFNMGGGVLFSNKTGLIAYYKLDSNGNDYSGDTHNGTSTNINYANAGKVGNSATFNGTTSIISVPQSIDYDFTNRAGDVPFSVSLWFYLGATSSYKQLVSKNNTITGQWEVRYASGKINLVVYQTNAIYKIFLGSSTLSVSNWYHLVVTYDGLALNSSCKIYLNNVLETITNSNAGTYLRMKKSVQPFLIGGGNPGSYFQGQIDEVGIYRNQVLTAGEVNTLYTNGLAGIPIM